MSRVLLFVQTGDARPKCAWVSKSARRVAACYERDEARNDASSGPRDYVPRWWLVECENAEDGRAVIAAMVEYGGNVGEQGLGRILATGPRR